MTDQPSAQSMFFDILSKQGERIGQLEANQQFIYKTLWSLSRAIHGENTFTVTDAMLEEKLKERLK
jgi:hypothetical protein